MDQPTSHSQVPNGGLGQRPTPEELARDQQRLAHMQGGAPAYPAPYPQPYPQQGYAPPQAYPHPQGYPPQGMMPPQQPYPMPYPMPYPQQPQAYPHPQGYPPQGMMPPQQPYPMPYPMPYPQQPQAYPHPQGMMPTPQPHPQQAEIDQRQRAEAEAHMRQRAMAEAEAKHKAEQEAALAAHQRAEAEAKQRAEQEAAAHAAQQRAMAEADAKQHTEQDAQQRAAYEAAQQQVAIAAQQHYGASPEEQAQHPNLQPPQTPPAPTHPEGNEAHQAPAAPSDNKPKLRIGERLIELGLVSQDQLQVALQEQRSSKRMLGNVLVDMGFVTESAIAEVLAESAGKERFNAKSVMIDSNVIKLVPKNVAVRNKVIPVAVEDGNLQLAMADIYNVVAVDQVRRGLPRGMDIIPLFCTESEIQELIGQYYDYAIDIDSILREIETGIRENSEAVLDGAQDNYISPTVRLVNALLMDSIKQGASDIHFEPEGSFLRLRYRIDGAMTQIRSFHRDYWSAILVRIKIMSGMNIAETRNPQDGRISFQFMGREVDFRVATQPTIHGENVVMRLLDKSKSLMPLEKLGFTDESIVLLRKMLKRPEGIIIVTGPTGSGKTTSLYSVLNLINNIDVNIMTLEDPVEYMLPLIRQTHVKEGGMDFLTGIKSLMRQDPDIIFLGEVRDEETALMAVRAAMTGHQVFTTLHTNDALGAIPRLNDIGVPSHLLSGSLIAVMAQRLARKLCSCKQAYTASPEDCKILRVDPASPPTLYRAAGCPDCGHRGYKGRMVIAEILAVDKGMDELIAANSSRSQLMDHALSQGFIPMTEDGVRKTIAGHLDIKELIKRIDMTERM